MMSMFRTYYRVAKVGKSGKYIVEEGKLSLGGGERWTYLPPPPCEPMRYNTLEEAVAVADKFQDEDNKRYANFMAQARHDVVYTAEAK